VIVRESLKPVPAAADGGGMTAPRTSSERTPADPDDLLAARLAVPGVRLRGTMLVERTAVVLTRSDDPPVIARIDPGSDEAARRAA